MANVDIEHCSEEITAELMSLLLEADPDEGLILVYLSDSSVLVAKESTVNLTHSCILRAP